MSPDDFLPMSQWARHRDHQPAAPRVMTTTILTDPTFSEPRHSWSIHAGGRMVLSGYAGCHDAALAAAVAARAKLVGPDDADVLATLCEPVRDSEVPTEELK